MTKTTIPSALKTVARLFIISGGLLLIHSTLWMMHGRLIPDFGILAFWVGFGLLSGKRIYWVFARAILATMLILLSTATTIMPFISINTMGIASLMVPISAIILTLYLMLTFWQYRVIIRPDVREFFPDKQMTTTSILKHFHKLTSLIKWLYSKI